MVSQNENSKLLKAELSWDSQHSSILSDCKPTGPVFQLWVCAPLLHPINIHTHSVWFLWLVGSLH